MHHTLGLTTDAKVAQLSAPSCVSADDLPLPAHRLDIPPVSMSFLPPPLQVGGWVRWAHDQSSAVGSKHRTHASETKKVGLMTEKDELAWGLSGTRFAVEGLMRSFGGGELDVVSLLSMSYPCYAV